MLRRCIYECVDFVDNLVNDCDGYFHQQLKIIVLFPIMCPMCVLFQRRSGDGVYHESVQPLSAQSSAAFRDCGQTGAGLSQLCQGETHKHKHTTLFIYKAF